MRCCLIGFALLALFGTSALASESFTGSNADRLVAEALAAEAAGDADRRAMLLDQAVAVSPGHQLARWQRGEIEVDGRWQSIESLQQIAAEDPRRAEYLRLREAVDDSLAAQLALARWCRKNNLNDEAWFHWANVISRQPGHEEALRALGMRWYRNRLLTYDQIEDAKQRARDAHRAAKRWAPKTTQWQREIAGDLARREAALEEIRAVDDLDAIPALEELTLKEDVASDLDRVRCRQISEAFVEALTAMPSQQATESLLRHALISPVPAVRSDAIAALRARPMHDYVPLLLNALAMPIESSFRVATSGDGSVHYWHSFYRAGRNADWSVDGRYSAMQLDLQGPTRLVTVDRIRDEVRVDTDYAGTNPALMAEVAAVASQNQGRFASRASSIEQQVVQINSATVDSNRRITDLLAETTDEDKGDDPRAWWSWWNEYNETYSEGETPVYARRYGESERRYYRPPRTYVRRIEPPPPPGKYSCFAAGTVVWTKSGPQAIETLEIGDLVLAQDADSGELSYKPILGRTVRPPTEIIKIELRGKKDEGLLTTLGHPLWVDGIGWRMAKFVDEDAILHGVDGPVRVASVEPAGEAEAYNLIVADFNTYFVGEQGILVHDNTPREPTTAVVPGLAAK